MPECTVCGDNDFLEQAGHFYCTTCNTQSQDYRVVEVDVDAMADWTGHTNVIREKKTTSKKEKKVVDKGRPWSIYEAYQIIMLNQVEAFIKLGAQPELKDVVFKLWVNYLSKLGVAFTDQPLVTELQKYGRQRELFPGTTKEPKIKNVLGRSRRKKTVGISAKEAALQIEKDKMAEAIEGEEFYEGDNPLEDNEEEDPKKKNDEDEEEDESCDEEEDLELWGNRRKSLNPRSAYKMQMVNTLALCYLGLMYTNPLTTATDILRWVESGKIPYRKVTDLLTDDMKFCFNDWKMFGMGTVPTLKRLRLTAGTLAQFLNLKDFPEFPMAQLVSKYILLLDLPAELHAYTMNLYKCENTVKVYTPSKTFNRIVFWEGMAMAYIILVLKLIFGLDDHTERLFSVYSREIMKLIDNSQRLFVWEDWMSHITSKVQLSESDITRDDYSDDNEASTTDNLVTKVSKDKVGIQYLDISVRLYQTKTRNAIQKPLLELSDRWGTKQRHTKDNTGNQSGDENMTLDPEFDLTANTLHDEDPVGYLLGLHDSDETDLESQGARNTCHRTSHRDSEMKQKSEYFHGCSVQHLINPETYLDELNREGLMDMSIYSSCTESTIAEDEEHEHVDMNIHDENSVDLFQEYASPCKKRKNVEHKKCDNQSREKSSLRTFVEANVLPVPTVSKIVNKERYQFVMDQVKHVKEQFLLTFNSESTRTFVGYNWLLYVCGHVISCTPDQLQEEVRKLEVKLFAEGEDMSQKGRAKLKQMKFNKANYFAKRFTEF